MKNEPVVQVLGITHCGFVPWLCLCVLGEGSHPRRALDHLL